MFISISGLSAWFQARPGCCTQVKRCFRPACPRCAACCRCGSRQRVRERWRRLDLGGCGAVPCRQSHGRPGSRRAAAGWRLVRPARPGRGDRSAGRDRHVRDDSSRASTRAIACSSIPQAVAVTRTRFTIRWVRVSWFIFGCSLPGGSGDGLVRRPAGLRLRQGEVAKVAGPACASHAGCGACRSRTRRE